MIKKNPANPAAYLNRARKAPLAFVTRLVLYYVRKNLYNVEEVSEKAALPDDEIVFDGFKEDETGRLIRLRKYMELLMKKDEASFEKIRQIDEILKGE